MKYFLHFFFLLTVMNGILNTVTAQWVKQTTPVTNRLLSLSLVTSQTAYAASEGGKFLRTSNGGNTWNEVNTGMFGSFSVVRFVNDTGYLFGNGPTVLRSTNGGTNWTTLDLSLPGATGVGYVTSGTLFNGLNGIVCGYYNAGGNLKAYLARTTNAGTDWQVQIHDSVTSFWSLFFTDSSTGYVVGSANGKMSPIFKTTNGGETWARLQSNTYSSLKSVHFFNAQHGYIGGAGGTILVTSDAGATWNIRNVGFYTITSVAAVHADTVFAVSEDGPGGTIYRSVDHGTTWSAQWRNTQAFQSISFINSSTGFTAGDSGQIFRSSVSGTTDVRRSSDRSPKYHLEQNFPNPFNPSTTVSFQLQKDGRVTVKIYDLMGKHISTLVDQHSSAGSYSVQWNANGLSSGTYLMRMEAGEFSETKSVVLMK